MDTCKPPTSMLRAKQAMVVCENHAFFLENSSADSTPTHILKAVGTASTVAGGKECVLENVTDAY